MKNLKFLAVVLSLGLFVSGCSYFETGEPDVSSDPDDTIDLLNPAQAPEEGRVTLEPRESFNDIGNNVSTGNVEVFSLDGPVQPQESIIPTQTPSVQPGVTLTPPRAGVPSNDGRVEVFPLSGGVSLPTISPTISAPSASAPIASGSDFVSVRTASRGNYTIYFNHDSTQLDGEDRNVISQVVRDLGGNLGRPVSVDGYASVRSSLSDPVQRKIINLKISMDRAFQVARALMERGVPGEAIQTRAFGENNSRGLSEGETRRVEINQL